MLLTQFFAISICLQPVNATTTPSQAPTSRPSIQTSHVFTVVGLRGRVEIRHPEEQWQRLEVSAKLSPGDAVRVGIKSSLQLRDESGGEVTLDRMGVTLLRDTLPKRNPTTRPDGRYDLPNEKLRTFDDSQDGRA
jgi:hypothetical protein